MIRNDQTRDTNAPDRQHSETTRIRGIYERDADGYDEEVRHFEKRLLEDGRQWACGQAVGDVLEIAIGTGRNLPFYPAGVRLTGIDLTPMMLARAEQRARTLGRDVTLAVGDAQALDFPDDTFDSVVMTLALCTIPDERKAIAEAKRVLRDHGRLIMLEHVRSPHLPVRILQRTLDPLFVRWKGDHLMREPLEPVCAEGFTIMESERRKWGIIERIVAEKPAETGWK